MGLETLVLLASAATAGAAASGAFSSKPSAPKARAAENKKETAEALPQGSEAAKKNRRRAASVFTKDFAPPTLSQSGLLGL